MTRRLAQRFVAAIFVVGLLLAPLASQAPIAWEPVIPPQGVSGDLNIPRRGGHGSCHEQPARDGLLELVW